MVSDNLITINVDLEGVRRSFRLLTARWSDVVPILRAFDRYKRAQVADMFASGGNGQWPPHASATLAGRRQVAHARFEKKLKREVKRAERSYQRQLGRFQVLRAFGGLGKRQRAPKTTAMISRLATLGEFRRIAAGGGAVGLLTEKQQRSLTMRVARAEAKAVSAPLLGRIPQTLQSTIENGLWRLESTWAPAKIHNEGGTAGNNAQIPERRFLEILPHDLEYLRVLLIEAGLLAMES